MDIRIKIKEYMRKKKLNVYKLAKKSGLTQPCVANWFNERNYTPSIDALEKVCVGMEISMAELFCDDNEEMVLVNDEERDLLSVWRIMQGEQRKQVLSMLKSFIK